MKRLSAHILSLLRFYDKVVLPQFGFFRKEHVPASIVKESFLLSPPSYSLLFYKTEHETDNMLLQSYIKREGTGESEAAALLKDDIQKLLSSLDITGEAILPGIGIFRKIDDAFYFNPAFAFNGILPTLSLKKEKVNVPAAEEIAVESESETEATADNISWHYFEKRPENNDNDREIPKGYHFHKPEYYYIPVHRKLAKFAAAILLVIIVGLSAVIPLNQSGAVSSTARISPVNMSDSYDSASRVTKIVTPSPADQLEEEEIIIEEAALPEEDLIYDDEYISFEDHKYFAVVAAFKSMKTVDEFIILHPGDADRFKVIDNSSYHLITIASSVSKDELEQQLPEIRAHYRDVWVYTKK